MALPKTTRNAVNRQSANAKPATPKKDTAKDLQIELISINPETSMYTRADGSEMERQTGLAFCPAINCDVVVTRSLVDKDGNDKTEMNESHIGRTFNALVNKVTMENGDVVFFAEISLGRGSASEESINLFDSL